jgi:MYXO-CTERM domain-containing protein
MSTIHAILVSSVSVLAIAATVNAAELTTNGGFELGDTSGWLSFPTAGSTFNISTDTAGSLFAAEVFNNTSTSAAVVKQANIGVGIVNPGDMILITFAAKGSFANGGVAFAELFSEKAGGGVSNSWLLGNAPLALTDSYKTFNFLVAAGTDVSGGITLQFASVAGADAGSVAVLFIDNVSVTVVPTPASGALLGLAGLVATRRRR